MGIAFRVAVTILLVTMVFLVGVIVAQIGSTPKTLQVKIRSEGAHYYPRVTINGTPVRLMADTGATFVTLSTEDARKVGIDPRSLQFTHKFWTGNGSVWRARITLPEITVAGIVLRNVPAACCGSLSLLGMSALGRFNVTMDNGLMVLSPKS